MLVIANVFSFTSGSLLARLCGQKKALFQSCESSIFELCAYSCEVEAAQQFHRWHAISEPHLKNTANGVIIKGHQHSFVDYSYWPRLDTVVQYRTHCRLVDTDLNGT